MAEKKILVDDLDGNEEDVKTVRLNVDGTQYQIDLGKANQKVLHDALKPFLAKARTTKKQGESRAAKVRRWAEENGVAIPARGRIPASVDEQYQAATSGK